MRRTNVEVELVRSLLTLLMPLPMSTRAHVMYLPANMVFLSGPMMSSGPHPSVPLTQAQIAQQQQAQAQASELAKRRSRKPTDKNIPEGVEDSIVDVDGVQRYKDLRDVERRLDATITRKRLDIVDYTSRGSKVSLKLVKTCYETPIERPSRDTKHCEFGSATRSKIRSGKVTD